MQFDRLGRLTAVGLAAALALAACGGDSGSSSGADASGGAGLAGTLSGAGASSQTAAMQGWQAGFQNANPDVTVNYDPVGSGGGREQFLAGGTTFAGSDAYLDDSELATAKDSCGAGGAIDLPVYISPIAVVFNVEGVDNLNLGPAALAGIFAQEIINWNDPAIAADNPDAQLPDLTITPVNRSDKSGTTENFIDYLSVVAPDVWTYEVSGDWPVPGGEQGQGTSGVIQAVGAGNGTIGYADASQAGDLGVAKIGVGVEFVEYSPDAAAAVVEKSTPAEGRGEFDLAIDLVRDTTESGTYPIVLLSYHVVCLQYDDESELNLVKAFESYVVSAEGQQAAADAAGSAPISDQLREQVQASIDAIELAGS